MNSEMDALRAESPALEFDEATSQRIRARINASLSSQDPASDDRTDEPQPSEPLFEVARPR